MSSEIKPKLSFLPNKIPFIEVPMPGATSMTIFVYCRVGSRYEWKNINGASHFIEHLMFKGTKRRPNTEIISRELDGYGASYNAMTGKDYTAYYVKIDATQSVKAADILQDMLLHSKFDPKEIDRERGVIIEEINMYEDNPQMNIDDLIEGVLYPDSTLGWNIAGPREVIRKISRDELIAYRDAYYVPSRMVVAVAGAIRPDLKAKVKATFGALRAPKTPEDGAYEPFVPKPLKDRIALQVKETEQTQVAIAFHGFARDHADEPAAKLLASILGGSMSSRLFINVRERKGLCYSISAAHEALEDTGSFSIFAGLDRKRLPLAIETIFKELRSIMKSGVTAEEFRRAKDHIRGRLALAFEDSSVRADWYGRAYLFRKSLETPEERLAVIDKVTRADVQRVARALFSDEHMASAVIGPHADKPTLEKIFRMG